MMNLNLCVLWSYILIGASFASNVQSQKMDESSAYYQVFMAVHQDDIDQLKAASKLEDFAEALNSQPDRSGQTPLMRAVLQGKSPELVRTLMELGADPSIGEKDGYTPMHGVGFQGRYNLIPVLVEEFNLDPNDVHEDGFTPLHRACWGSQGRHTLTVEALIGVGADPDKLMCRPSSGCLHPIDATQNEQTKKILLKYTKEYLNGSGAEF